MASTPLTSFAGRLGTASGQILGGIVEGYAAHKYDQMLQARQRQLEDQRFKDLKTFMPGASDQQIRALVGLGEKIQHGALQGGFGAQPTQEPALAQPLPGQGAQIPSMLMQQQPQQPQQQFNPLAALQQLTPQAQQQVSTAPKYFQEELLRRLGQEDKEKRGQMGQVPEEQRLMPQQVPQPQRPMINQPIAAQPPISLGQALRGDKESKKAAQQKLDPAQAQFLQTAEVDAGNVKKLRPVLKEILDYAEKNKKKIKWNIYSDYAPTQGLNKETAKMRNLMADFLVKKSAIEQKGQGSNLQRKQIEAAKLFFQQGYDVFTDTAQRFLEELDDSSLLTEAAENIRKANNGEYPADIGTQARNLVEQEKSQFNNLPDEDKYQYLIQNPTKFGYINEITDENGDVIAYRTPNGSWKEKR
jgi:hypothetical protein